MKNILFSFVIALGLSSVNAFANEPAAAPAPAGTTQETSTSADHAKVDKKAAKEACKDKKGKEHKACMKEQLGK